MKPYAGGRFISMFSFLCYSLVSVQIYKILSAVTILQNFAKVNVELVDFSLT